MPPIPLPTVRCPLKAVGLFANPAVATIDPKRLTELSQCDGAQCGFWSSVVVEIEDDETGETRRRTIEGCGVSVVAQHVSAAADSLDNLQEAADAAQESLGTVQTIVTAVAGLAARRFGVEEELAQAIDAAEAAEEEEEEGEEEGGEEEGAVEEEEEEAQA